MFVAKLVVWFVMLLLFVPGAAASATVREFQDARVVRTLGVASEVTLAAAAPVAAPVVTASLVQTIATSAWSPGSPDPSGIVYLPGPDRMMVADSEVDETTGAGYHGVNLWQVTRTGAVRDTGNTLLYSKEPTGVGYDPGTDTLFISDDSKQRVFLVKRGSDGRFGTSDDIVTSIDAGAYGSTDTEDPEFDPSSGHLFFLDGVGTEVFDIDPVDGVFGDGDDVMVHFDVGRFGPSDFEGLGSDPSSGNLLVGARSTEEIFEVTKSGSLVRIIDASGISGLKHISGLAMAPASNNSGVKNYWIVDRATDNGSNANENDGKVFEISIGSSSNNPPDLTNPGTMTNAEGDRVSYQIQASDPDPGDSIASYGTSGLPTGLGVDSNTGLISGTTTTTGTYRVTISATDDHGATGSTAFTWTVSSPTGNLPPVVTNPGDRNSDEGQTVSLQIQATDPEGDTPLTYAASGLPNGLTINSSTGLIGGAVGAVTPGGRSFGTTVIVTDVKGASSDTSFTWTVRDTTAPPKPTGVTGSTSTIGNTLAWNAGSAPDLAGYNVWRGGTKLNGSPLTTPSYTDTTTPAGQTSNYGVTAIDTSGNESAAASIGVTRAEIALVGTSSAVQNHGTSVTIAEPAGVQEGDLLLAAITVAGAPTVSASGWTVVPDVEIVTSGNEIRTVVYSRQVGSSEPSSYSFTFGSRQSAAGVIVAYRGAATSIDSADSQANGSSLSITAPSLTTSSSNDALVGFFAINAKTSVAPDGQMLEQAEAAVTGKGKLTIEAADQVLSSAGATATRIATAGTSAKNIGVLVALAAA